MIYILGHGRSGSTILHSLLAQISGFVGVGELRTLLDPGVVENGRCGCGLPIHECAVWSRVLGVSPGLLDTAGWPLNMVVRDRYLPLMWYPIRKVFLRSFLRDHSERVSQLYQAIHMITRSRVIVDSSKSVAYAAFLNQVPGITPYFIHIVRDPRGVEYSLRRRKEAHVKGFANHTPRKGALAWSIINVSTEAFGSRVSGRYLRLRYEDFVQDPTGALTRILSWASEPDVEIPVIEGQRVHLDIVHSIAGNAKRFEHGDIQLKLDERWKSDLPPRDRKLVALLTFPLLKRYGYPIAVS